MIIHLIDFIMKAVNRRRGGNGGISTKYFIVYLTQGFELTNAGFEEKRGVDLRLLWMIVLEAVTGHTNYIQYEGYDSRQLF